MHIEINSQTRLVMIVNRLPLNIFNKRILKLISFIFRITTAMTRNDSNIKNKNYIDGYSYGTLTKSCNITIAIIMTTLMKVILILAQR